MQAPSGSRPGMPVGSRGILVSCVTSKEQQAGREASNLFAEVRRLGRGWVGGSSHARCKHALAWSAHTVKAFSMKSRGLHSRHVTSCCPATRACSQAYEELGGTWKTRAGGAATEAADDGDAAGGAAPTDIAAVLASEVAELKEPGKQPFR